MQTTEELEAELAELRTKLRELESELHRRRLAEPIYALADALHTIDCRRNHTDGCDWGHDSWEKPGYVRGLYLVRVRMMNDAGFNLGGTAVLLNNIHKILNSPLSPRDAT